MKQGNVRMRAVKWASAVMVLLMTLLSCTGRLETTIRNDLSARMSLRLDLPEALSARVRQISGIPAGAGLFDIPRLKSEFAGRDSIFLVDVSAASADSMTSVIWIPDLVEFSKDLTLVPEGLVAVRSLPASGSLPAQKELSVSITRSNAAAAFRLFPGMDGKLLESLSPPALEADPVTAAEYRMNLEMVIIGKKAMPAFDACVLDISITAPKTILSSSGGTANGQVFRAKLPLFDFLTLEKPMAFSVRWAE